MSADVSKAFGIIMMLAVIAVFGAMFIGTFYVPQEWKIPVPEGESNNVALILICVTFMLIAVEENTRRRR